MLRAPRVEMESKSDESRSPIQSSPIQSNPIYIPYNRCVPVRYSTPPTLVWYSRYSVGRCRSSWAAVRSLNYQATFLRHEDTDKTACMPPCYLPWQGSILLQKKQKRRLRDTTTESRGAVETPTPTSQRARHGLTVPAPPHSSESIVLLLPYRAL